MKTEQQKEIETIKERTIKLKLSDADCWRLSKKAAYLGISIPDLLENFIGDLVAGTYSNGSDERMYANAWYERCGFGMQQDDTFVAYLLREWLMDDAIETWGSLQSSVNCIERNKTAVETGVMYCCGESYTWEDIDDSEGNKAYHTIEEWREEVLDEIRDEEKNVIYYRKILEPIYEDYKSKAENTAVGSMEEEFEKLMIWRKEQDEFMGVQEGN